MGSSKSKLAAYPINEEDAPRDTDRTSARAFAELVAVARAAATPGEAAAAVSAWTSANAAKAAAIRQICVRELFPVWAVAGAEVAEADGARVPTVASAVASAVVGLVERCPRLQLLDAVDCPGLDEAGLARLAGALAHTPGLQHLDLSGTTPFGGAGASPLLAAIGRLPKLVVLRLRNLNIPDASALAASLAATPLLAHLDLSFTNLGSEGARAIAPALRGTPRLAALNLSGCGIRDEGAAAVAAALSYTPNLLYLSVDSCSIGDAGMASLARALIQVPQLLQLAVSHNTWGKAGATALGAGLAHVPRLQRLAIHSTPIGDEGVVAFAAAVAALPQLEFLSACYIGAFPAGMRALMAALARAPHLHQLVLGEAGDAGADSGPLQDAVAAGLPALKALQQFHPHGNIVDVHERLDPRQRAVIRPFFTLGYPHAIAGRTAKADRVPPGPGLPVHAL